jgi:signal peptidase I
VSEPATLDGERPGNKAVGRRAVLVFILALALVEFVRYSFGTFSVVEGPSMLPTFKPNDVVQAKVSYAEPERGGVVIIAENRGDRVIKRVIGLPGETVTLYRGYVYINGQRLREPYLPGHTYTFKSNQADERAVAWRLGDDQFFVMGDNRLESHDSRHYGPVDRHQISQLVNLPENEAKPEFCGIMLSETRKVLPGKPGHRSPVGNRVPNQQPNAAAKS